MHKHEVLVMMPYVSQSYLKYFSGAFENQKQTGEYCARSEQGHAIARNAILSDES